MAYKTLIFGIDELFEDLKPLYEREVKRGTLEIVGYAIPEKDGFKLVTPKGKPGGGR